MNQTSKTREPDWTTIFGRSRAVPCLFPVHRQRDEASEAGNPVRDYIHRLEVPGVRDSSMYMPSMLAWPLLDGAVCYLGSYGLPPMPSGWRVLGTRPLRLLCHELGVRPPRRLKEERGDPPSPEELREELRVMLSRPEEELLAQAEKALFYDTPGALCAVRELFGDDVTARGG